MRDFMACKDLKMIDNITHEANTLISHRASIDRLDAILVYTLGERFKHTQALSKLKAKHSLSPSDPAREERQIERLNQLSLDANLDPDFAKRFLTFIIAEVVRNHKQHQS
jgi:chorismate mutase